MAEPGKKLIGVLLDRLYATLVNGPLMSCRPHSSRQRVDLFQLGKLKGPEPREVISSLMSGGGSVKLSASGEMSERAAGAAAGPADELKGLVGKLRTITEDARTYEEDTGTQALFVGFPLLNLPPEASVGGIRSSKRILAPLAFLPLRITLKATRPPSVQFEAIGEGADLLVPNSALLAWVERMTGKDLGELFADDEGSDPWGELNEIVRAITNALELPAPAPLSAQTLFVPTPRSDQDDSRQPGIVNAAVIGLFPAANQGLLRDLEALSDGEPALGPIESFLKAGTDLGVRRDPTLAETTTSLAGSERCVSQVDPCQARAVHLARKVNGLVIHGPPGTGKSQTITNIIGDHLANGERVLFVCDKRTALDVVSYRLNHLGLGSLCAVVHDARRDQRELYRSIKDQLDTLPDTAGYATSVAELQQVDAEISRIHAELTRFEQALAARPNGVAPSFHELVGTWFASRPASELSQTAELPGVTLEDLLPLESLVKEAADRGRAEAYVQNPWTDVLASDLKTFLAKPHDDWEKRARRLVETAQRVDALSSPGMISFAIDGDPREEGRARRELGGLVESALSVSSPRLIAQWLEAEPGKLHSATADLDAAVPYVELVESPPDRELALAGGANTAAGELVPWLGRASFEGLFVRNLENVQGDERDHMIISTTYGPDQHGRFYRRFGPLGQAGGGRRLNVLVTRARSMVHLVTSIPSAVYQSRPEIPAGTNPNGAMLLFAYLAYAERLERLYKEAAQRAIAAKQVREAHCDVLDTRYPSSLAAALGQHLQGEHGISSLVHWGNDGFAVDAALVHPDRPEDVTIGVLCDGSRFEKAADRVQWDIFRTEVLEAQRWRLHRLWSPQFFRDPKGAIAKLKKAAQEWLAEESAAKQTAAREKAAEVRLLN